jgi:hypothetical protein
MNGTSRLSLGQREPVAGANRSGGKQNGSVSPRPKKSVGFGGLPPLAGQRLTGRGKWILSCTLRVKLGGTASTLVPN